MGLRDWFRKSTSGRPTAEDNEPSSVAEEPFSHTFEEMQAQRANEALSLFDEHDEISEPTAPAIEAPYDAGQAEPEALLADDMGEAFTHADEVHIKDVNELDDPYLQATVEGDVPEPVRLEEGENPVVD
jgi:hypothetical protein